MDAVCRCPRRSRPVIAHTWIGKDFGGLQIYSVPGYGLTGVWWRCSEERRNRVGDTSGRLSRVLPNLASAEASNEGDDTLDNNEASAEIEVLCPDVAVEKSAGTAVISAGDEASFTITVSNIGDGNAYDVVVTDVLPAGITWAIDPAVDGCAITDGTLECTIATLAPGESVEIIVVGTTDAADCGILTNTVTVEAGNEAPADEPQTARRGWMAQEPPDVTANNTATAEMTINCPDVMVEKTAANDVITAGEQASFTITVSNTGEGNAYDVVVTDELPAGFNWVVSGDVAEDCAEDGGNLVCTIPVLGPGESAEIIVSAPSTVATCGVATNAVTVEASNEAEDLAGNNAASAEITINCPTPAPETPDTPGTPIHTLPVTGQGGSDSGSAIGLWVQLAAAMLMIAGAAAYGTGKVRSRR